MVNKNHIWCVLSATSFAETALRFRTSKKKCKIPRLNPPSADRLLTFVFSCFSQVTDRRQAVSRARPADTSAATWARAWEANTSAPARRPARLRCRATCRPCRPCTTRPACQVRRPSCRGTWSRRTWRCPATRITIRIIRPPVTCRSTAGTRPTAPTRAFYREYNRTPLL